MLTTDIIKLVITGISVIDFIVFFILFAVYLIYVGWKAKEITDKLGSIVILLFFIAFKTIHIPAFLSYISFTKITFPFSDILLLILTWTNIILAFFPLLFAYITVFRNKQKKPNNNISKHVNIVMPIYNEEPSVLFSAIKSVQKLSFDSKKIHLFLAFDEEYVTDTFTFIANKFGVTDMSKKIISFEDGITISMCRFNHGGKKSAQEGAFKLIKKLYGETFLNDSLLFFIDSDIQLKSNCLTEFLNYLETNNKNCATGIVTCITSETLNFLSYFQDIEYVSGQILWRNFENYLGTTSCLPGAFTILKWNTFNTVAKDYFQKKKFDDPFEYQRFYLGEDRYLTHLLMEKEPWKIGFCENARCKTEGPTTIFSLLKQRKRWFLGHIANDTWLLSSFNLWLKYPLFTLFNFLNNSRNTSIYVYLLYFVLLFDKNIPFYLWLLYVILPICLNWVFIVFYAFRLKRKMNILFYILNILIQPIFSMCIMYYTITNITKQSWGGIRVERPQSYMIANQIANNRNTFIISDDLEFQYTHVLQKQIENEFEDVVNNRDTIKITIE